MSVDPFLYDTAKRDFALGVHAWVSGTYKVMLATSGYTPSPDHEFVSSASSSELTGTGYTAGYGGAGRKALANKAVNIVSETGTAQAGGASTITLASGANATDGYYVGSSVRLTGGTGSGQVGWIIAYNGTTKVATVRTAWTTAPDGTTTYKVTRVSLDADDSAWTTINAGTAAYALIIKETGGNDASSLLVACIPINLPTTGGNGTVSWSADGIVVLP